MPFCAENRLHYFFKPIIMVFDMMEDSMTRKDAATGPDFSPVRGKRLLIALSGGADSVALAVMLAEAREEYDLTLCAVHVDHGIRPESAEDAEFCRRLCGRLDIPFCTERVDAPGMARRERCGLETAARYLRLWVLERAFDQTRSDYIVTAHHMDDQAETVLMHLARGAGMQGLCGMRTLFGEFYRPLLQYRKAELTRYLAARGYAWREDSTNRVADNPRNALRLKVIPEIERWYPGFVRAAARCADTAQIESDYLDEQTYAFIQKGGACPFCAWLEVDPPPHRAILRRAIRGRSPEALDWEQVNVLEALCGQKRGKLDIGADYFAERTGHRLYFVPKSPPEIAPVTLALEGETRLAGIGSVVADPGPAMPIRDDANRQALNPEALRGAVLRTRRPGDRIRPLGCGDKLLSDYLIDRKVDRPLRDAVPLVAIGDRVLWAVGLGIAQEARLTGEGPAVILKYIPETTNDDGGEYHGE